MESIFCGSGMKGSGVKVLCADTAPDIIAMTTAKKVDLHIRVSPFCPNGSQNFPQPEGEGNTACTKRLVNERVFASPSPQSTLETNRRTRESAGFGNSAISGLVAAACFALA
jgi:hypothetical protein